MIIKNKKFSNVVYQMKIKKGRSNDQIQVKL